MMFRRRSAGAAAGAHPVRVQGTLVRVMLWWGSGRHRGAVAGEVVSMPLVVLLLLLARACKGTNRSIEWI
jgi:hypothetical protein